MEQATNIASLASQLIAALSAAYDDAMDAEGLSTISLTELLWGAAPDESLQKLRDLLNPPDVCAVGVRVDDDKLEMDLEDGRCISVPLKYFPRLLTGPAPLRDNWQLVSGGIFIHWEELDEDLSINGLLAPRPLDRRTRRGAQDRAPPKAKS